MKMTSFAMLAMSGLLITFFAYIAPAMADDASTPGNSNNGQIVQPLPSDTTTPPPVMNNQPVANNPNQPAMPSDNPATPSTDNPATPPLNNSQPASTMPDIDSAVQNQNDTNSMPAPNMDTTPGPDNNINSNSNTNPNNPGADEGSPDTATGDDDY